MHPPGLSMLRCWDGKSKVAAIWTHDSKEPGLCPPEGDCLVYTSEEQKQRDDPTFRTSFDKLISYGCQPLMELSSLVASHCEERENNPTLSDVEEVQHTNTSSLRPRSNISLVLTPPSSYNIEQVQEYNITTRNFFAWTAGLPIVGLTPTLALQALKARMDVWRALSCDNITAVQQYARQQFYDDSSDFELLMTYNLRGSVSPPTGLQSISRRQSLGTFRSRIDKVVKFHQSPKSRSQSERRSSLPDTETNETPLSPHESQILASSDLSEGIHEVMSRSEAMSSKLPIIHLPLNSVHAQVTFDSAPTLDNSSDPLSTDANSKSRRLGHDDRLPNLPELDGSDHTQSTDGGKQGLLADNLNKESPDTIDMLLPSSPTSREPHRSVSNSSRLRRTSTKRACSSMQSAPPSPILEEVVIPGKRYPIFPFKHQRQHIRRYSLPPDTEQSSSKAPLVTGARSVEAVDKIAWDNNTMSPYSLLAASPHDRVAICKTCNRRKLPASDRSQHYAESSGDQFNDPTVAWKPSRTSSSSHVRNIPPLSRQTSGKGKGKVGQKNSPMISRFPSLRNGRESSSPSPIPMLPKKSAGRGLETTRWSPSSSRARIDRSVTSETEFITRQISNPKMQRKTTPLSQQRSTASLRSVPSVGRFAPRTTTPMSAIELPASTVKPEELDGSAQKEPDIDIELVPDQTTTLDPTDAVMLKSDGSQVSMSFNSPPGSPTAGFNTFSIIHCGYGSTPQDNNDRVLDQLLTGLRTIESNHQANRNRNTNFAKSVSRASSRPGATPIFRDSASRLSPSVTSKAAKRLSWSGSVKKWKSNHSPSASTATNESDSSATMSYSSTQPSSVDSKDTLQIRVLTMDKNGKFSTVMVDSSTDTYVW